MIVPLEVMSKVTGRGDLRTETICEQPEARRDKDGTTQQSYAHCGSWSKEMSSVTQGDV
jgi:hypothetical protein